MLEENHNGIIRGYYHAKYIADVGAKFVGF